MRATTATIEGLRTLHTTDDLAPAVRTIVAWSESGDTDLAKQGLAALQTYLRALSTDEMREREAEILDALAMFPYHRGARVTSWLQAHGIDSWSRAYWARAEDFLNPRLARA